MIKSVNEFDSIVYAVLESIRDSGNYNLLKEKYSAEQLDDAIEYAVNSNLILGINVFRNEAGGLQKDAIPNVRVTRDGLTFIENFVK